MAGNARKLRPKQKAVIAELLTGSTIAKACETVGVGERTVYRWLNNETFSTELRKAELQVLDGVGWRLVSLSGKAVDALENVLENPSQRGASVKRLCAKSILELLLTWRSQIVLEERVSKLEERVLHGNY